ncbi:hypothetical protein BOX15_Mlig009667g1 [Macrostomum lignano]|nr:hypothetical protein BOX15_Mlig009667g3 [Macrostomum lignano]PAA60289.1 hypothetical protein BOX15_Mlig009667g2 [Macrostomum lignano]PAA61089.1 hypothetical protein BOX15_Mlig009667g1 [Macrostomum lignano]
MASQECVEQIMTKYAKPLASNSTEELLKLVAYINSTQPRFLSDEKLCAKLLGRSDNAISLMFNVYATKMDSFYESEVIIALRVFVGLLALFVLFCFFLALFEPRDEDEALKCLTSWPELDLTALVTDGPPKVEAKRHAE